MRVGTSFLIGFIQLAAVLNFNIAYSQTESKLTPFDGEAEDQFGFSVALSGDYTIVGVPGKDISATNEGAAYIFHRTETNTWGIGTKIGPSDGQDFDSFGSSVAIDGDYTIVGVPGKDISGTSEGAAYIYHRSGTNIWSSGIKIIASDGQSNDRFGTAVSISGDYAIIGAPNQDGGGDDMGAAYIFHRTGLATWDSGIKIMASDAQNDEFFGHAVAINGDYAIVGSGSPFSNATGKGAAYIFMRTNTNSWDAQTKLEASDGIIGDHFGESVGIDGNYAIIGTPSHDDGSGAAYIFKRTSTNIWGNSTKIIAPSNTESNDWFGFRVGLEGDFAIISEHGDDLIGVNTGAAHIFHRIDSNNWESLKELRASDAQDDDIFGFAVDISNDYAIVGAINDDDNGSNSGSAYIYSEFNVSIPSQPTAQAQSGSNDGEIDLSWSSVTDADGYKIVYDEDSDNPPWTPSDDGIPGSGSDVENVTSITISGLTPDQTYYLSVAAYNSAGLGDYANQVSATATSPIGVTLINQGEIPEDYSLRQNYPNPFNPTTTIEYDLPVAMLVILSIYDVAGNVVEELVSEYQNQGIYRLLWDASDIASGIYFYRLQTGDYIETKKMLLLK